MDRLVIDASVIIASLLPDEPHYDAALRILGEFLSAKLELVSVPLIQFEITNALWQAVRRGRVRLEEAQAALRTFEAFNLPERAVSSQGILTAAHKYTRSAYDAAYLSLAMIEQVPLVTADKRLYNAVKDNLQIILWVEDFKST